MELRLISGEGLYLSYGNIWNIFFSNKECWILMIRRSLHCIPLDVENQYITNNRNMTRFLLINRQRVCTRGEETLNIRQQRRWKAHKRLRSLRSFPYFCISFLAHLQQYSHLLLSKSNRLIWHTRHTHLQCNGLLLPRNIIPSRGGGGGRQSAKDQTHFFRRSAVLLL